ncbi:MULTISPECIES: phage tail tape measure protein [unclassified Variovorax]|uniref:phage tail tape measure protein n=1 Tax=unclassified Variovorax TaxID=663243 RepID=UPI0025753E57|nr:MULTISPECIES: phage tail tape measure protein [unclassified Variovorax]MDM0090310.1 phage tail tape measure protein [Variovorax sp. J22G40]MDM0148024.1 phage tail tape measure protein [Variovorax sp. J2P1-31]
MSSRSLGTLTLELIAKIGGFEQGMDRAARTSDRKGREIAKAAKERAKETEQAWSKVGDLIGKAISAVTVGVVFKKFISETRDAEQEQVQLAAVLKSTGEAAGWSQEKLNDMAESMSKASIFSGGDINKAQTTLLEFTGIVGDTYPKALQYAADMATRRGMEIGAAAEVIGRALDSPKDGMSALSKQGFKFTEDQKALAERLQETGRTAEAQGIILQALETTYGGAAAAARDTFGGALSALQNTINDLLTGDTGSMKKLKASVEEMNSTLASPETKAAIHTLIGWMTDLSTAVVRGTANLIAFINAKNKLALLTGSDEFGKLAGAAAEHSHHLKILTERYERYQEALSRDPGNEQLIRNLARTRKSIDETQAKALAATAAVKDYANAQSPLEVAPKPSDEKVIPIDATGEAARAKAAKAAAAASEAAAKKAIAAEKAEREKAKTFIQGLNDQIAKTQELTSVEDVLRQMREGKITLNDTERDRAMGLATLIDMQKDLTKQRERDLAMSNAQTSAQREFNAELDRYAAELRGMGMGASVREKLAGVNQIGDKYAGQRDRLEDVRREAQLKGEWKPEAQAQYERELELIDTFHKKSLSAYETYYAQMREKQGDWNVGASEALANYLESNRNVAAQSEQLWSNAFRSMEDALVGFVTTGKLDFKSLANSIIADMARVEAKKFMTKALEGAGGSGSWMKAIAGLFGFSEGGYTGPGGKHQPAGIVHAGEVVWSQNDVRNAGGVGVVEAMRRGTRGYADGGVVGSGAGRVPFLDSAVAGAGGRVIIQNFAGVDVSSREQPNGEGGVDTVVMLRQLEGAMASNVAAGAGPLHRAMSQQFVRAGAR